MNSIKWFLSHPIQYFSPLLRALSKKTDLQVYYYTDPATSRGIDKGFGVEVKWDVDLLGGYPNQFIKNYSGRKSTDNHLGDVFNPGVFSIVRKSSGSVIVVNGWSYSSDLMVIFFSRIMGRQVWLRAENPLNQEIRKSGFKLFLKKIFLIPLLRLGVNKCLYIGSENKRFFEYYGVPSERLIYTPYAVDNDYFSSKADELKLQSASIKKKLGLPGERKLILFSGKYITKKNPLDLLKAFQLLGNEKYALVMMGEGELRTEMEKFITQNHLREVYLTGFVNQSEISDYYAVSDVFVMCSGMGETWGLAVNEAMNFGKPIIVSDTAGCSADLVRAGQNGYIFREGDHIALADFIRKILDDEKFCAEAGNKSREIIKAFSIDHIVGNITGSLAK